MLKLVFSIFIPTCPLLLLGDLCLSLYSGLYIIKHTSRGFHLNAKYAFQDPINLSCIIKQYHQTQSSAGSFVYIMAVIGFWKIYTLWDLIKMFFFSSSQSQTAFSWCNVFQQEISSLCFVIYSSNSGLQFSILFIITICYHKNSTTIARLVVDFSNPCDGARRSQCVSE